MRYFLVLIGLVLFFPAFSQKVCLNPETAQWYLEQADRAEILANRDSLNQQNLANKDFIIQQKDSIISSYQSDSLVYNQTIELQREELKSRQDRNAALRKEIRRQKTQKVFIAIGSGLLIILILI